MGRKTTSNFLANVGQLSAQVLCHRWSSLLALSEAMARALPSVMISAWMPTESAVCQSANTHWSPAGPPASNASHMARYHA